MSEARGSINEIARPQNRFADAGGRRPPVQSGHKGRVPKEPRTGAAVCVGRLWGSVPVFDRARAAVTQRGPEGLPRSLRVEQFEHALFHT